MQDFARIRRVAALKVVWKKLSLIKEESAYVRPYFLKNFKKNANKSIQMTGKGIQKNIPKIAAAHRPGRMPKKVKQSAKQTAKKAKKVPITKGASKQAMIRIIGKKSNMRNRLN